MEHPNEVTMASDLTYRVGERVRFHKGDTGLATIRQINVPKRGCIMFVLDDITYEEKREPSIHRWPLKDGGEYCSFTSEGVSGGCLYKLMKLGPLTDSEAKTLIPESVLKAGGGWFKDERAWFTNDGREWYACLGAHKWLMEVR